MALRRPSLYRDLRKEKYGSGEYDFSERTLNLLSESLLKQRKTKEAVEMMELNLEVNAPLTSWAFSVLAMSHQGNGDIDKAIADQKAKTPNAAPSPALVAGLVIGSPDFQRR